MKLSLTLTFAVACLSTLTSAAALPEFKHIAAKYEAPNNYPTPEYNYPSSPSKDYTYNGVHYTTIFNANQDGTYTGTITAVAKSYTDCSYLRALATTEDNHGFCDGLMIYDPDTRKSYKGDCITEYNTVADSCVRYFDVNYGSGYYDFKYVFTGKIIVVVIIESPTTAYASTTAYDYPYPSPTTTYNYPYPSPTTAYNYPYPSPTTTYNYPYPSPTTTYNYPYPSPTPYNPDFPANDPTKPWVDPYHDIQRDYVELDIYAKSIDSCKYIECFATKPDHTGFCDGLPLSPDGFEKCVKDLHDIALYCQEGFKNGKYENYVIQVKISAAKYPEWAKKFPNKYNDA
ncbi:hypothetical protein HDU97_002413 [Phlyctochytrium planicorne]|nr:hypothetical protein HDU97_002413 [Phlyctochytrium planicorne]